MIALATAEIGAISQRRIALMVDPALSFDLPPFLTPDPGLNSGLMIAEVSSAALMSENKHLANPCVTDSTPTSANRKTMFDGRTWARRLGRMVENLQYILGIELLCSSAGVEFRHPLKTSAPLQSRSGPFAPGHSATRRRPLHGARPGDREDTGCLRVIADRSAFACSLMREASGTEHCASMPLTRWARI